MVGHRPLGPRRSCPQLAHQHQQLLHHSSSRHLRPSHASPERFLQPSQRTAERLLARSPERFVSSGRAVTPGRVMQRVLSVERRVALSARRPGAESPGGVEELTAGFEGLATDRAMSTPRRGGGSFSVRQLSRPPPLGDEGQMATVARIFFAAGVDTPSIRRAYEQPPSFAPHPGVQHFCLSPAADQRPQQHPVGGDTGAQEPQGRVFEFFSAGESPGTPHRSCGSPRWSVDPAAKPSDLFTEVRRRMSMAPQPRAEPAVAVHSGAEVTRDLPEDSSANSGYVSDGAADADQSKVRERKTRHRRTVSNPDYGGPLQRRVSLGSSLQSTLERGSARLRSMETVMDSFTSCQRSAAAAEQQPAPDSVVLDDAWFIAASNVLEVAVAHDAHAPVSVVLDDGSPENSRRRTHSSRGEREVHAETQPMCFLQPLEVGLEIEAPDLGGSLYPDLASMVVRAVLTPNSVSDDVQPLPSPGTPMVCGIHDEVPVEVQRFLWGSKAAGADLRVKPSLVPACVQSLPMLRRYEVARRPRAMRCHAEVHHAMPFVQACN